MRACLLCYRFALGPRVESLYKCGGMLFHAARLGVTYPATRDIRS
jgi:hypothetical protein